jgi:hypothetical protein
MQTYVGQVAMINPITPLNERYLMITTILSEQLVEEMYFKLIPESLRILKQRGISVESFETDAIRDRNLKNAFTCFTLYAYADIPIGTKFDVLFDAKRAGHFNTMPMILKQIVLLLVDFYPQNSIGCGHKHFCTFDCPDGVPELILKAPKLTNWNELSIDFQLGLTNRESWEVVKNKYG